MLFRLPKYKRKSSDTGISTFQKLDTWIIIHSTDHGLTLTLFLFHKHLVETLVILSSGEKAQHT